MAAPNGLRGLRDAGLDPATFTLPAAASTSTNSAVIDLSAAAYKPENFEVSLSIPALSSVQAPATSTAGAIYIIESSTTSTFAATARTLASKTIAGSSGGIAATDLRTRVPADCERYIRGKVTFGTTMADSSAVAATMSLRF
jgi:hypothetical protein